MGELLPCPFCGHAAETETILTTTVRCSHCKARGPLMPTGEHTFETARDHDAITAWNTRPRTEGRGEGEKLFPLLASAWFYGDWKAETHNERQMQVVMERAGWWPITSEAELLEKLDASPIREPEISREAVEKHLRRMTGLFSGAVATADLRKLFDAERDAILNLAPVGGRTYQARVDEWVLACFGEEVARDVRERNHRFLEESLELVQSNGCTASEAHQLVDYVFGRPVGEHGQEVGGVMNTLAALCNAAGLDLNGEAERELARVWTKVEQIRAKHASKPKHSPLPGLTPSNEESQTNGS